MPTFSYSSGNPSNLTAGATASMADIQGPFVDLRTFINGGLGSSNLASNAGVLETQFATGSSGMAKGAFSVYRNAAVSLTTGTAVTFDAEEFDVSGWHDTATGRFTPQVPGYYRFSWSVAANVAMVTDAFWYSYLRKNGTAAKLGSLCFQRGSATMWSVGSYIQVANGSTDFFTVSVEHNNGAAMPVAVGAANTTFQGEFVGRS